MDRFPDLIDVLINVGVIVPLLIMFMQGVVSLMAYFLFVSSLVEIWGVSNENAMKYLPGSQRYSYGSALATMFISALMLATSTLQLIGMLSRSLSGDYAANRITPESLSYSGGGGLAEKAQIATLVLLGIMQAVGFIAIVKSFILFNSRFNDSHPRHGVGAGFTFLIGGLVCWNFKWFADLVNNQLGFNLIGLFAPW